MIPVVVAQALMLDVQRLNTTEILGNAAMTRRLSERFDHPLVCQNPWRLRGCGDDGTRRMRRSDRGLCSTLPWVARQRCGRHEFATQVAFHHAAAHHPCRPADPHATEQKPMPGVCFDAVRFGCPFPILVGPRLNFGR